MRNSKETSARCPCSWTAAVVSVALLNSLCDAEAFLVFSDNFDRGTSDSVGLTTTGGYAWSEAENAPSDVGLAANVLCLEGAVSDRRLVTVDLNSATGYKPILSQNPGLVTWTFNMSGSIYMSGFNTGERGFACILAGSETSKTDGIGYAVVFGDSLDGYWDQLRLVKYSGGLDADANLTTMVTTGKIFGENVAHRFGVKVTYDPADGMWRLYAARSAWDQPFPEPGLAPTVGSSVDSTHTSQTMPYTGFYLNSDFSSVRLYADNIALTVIPEPALVGSFTVLGLMGWALLHRANRMCS